MTLPNLSYWPAQGVIEAFIDDDGFLTLSSQGQKAPIEAHTSSVVEIPLTQSDSSPAVVGGCDDWVMPKLGFCLDISYDSIHKFFTPRTTIMNFHDAFFAKQYVRERRVQLGIVRVV